MIGRSGRLRWPCDMPGFVDPYALWNIDHAIERGNAMIDVDHAPVGGLGLLDPLASMFRPAALFGDSDDGEIFGLQAVEQFLPHGQVKATASPGRPGGEEDFCAAEF